MEAPTPETAIDRSHALHYWIERKCTSTDATNNTPNVTNYYVPVPTMTSIHHPPQPQHGRSTIVQKRPLLQPNLRLTHIQWIDCGGGVQASSSSSHAAAAASSSSSTRYNNNNNNFQARSVSWNTTGSLLAVGCSDATIRFWNPVTMGDTSSSSSSTSSSLESSCCGSIHTLSTTTTNTSSSGNTTNNNSNLPMIAATFHPTSDPILGSMTAGSGTVRLWDVRTNTPSSTSSAATTTASNSNSTATAATASTMSSTIAFTSLSQCPIMGLHRTSSTTTTAASPLPIVVAVEWNPIQTHFISCTTHDGRVSIYDTRKFTNTTTTTSNNNHHHHPALVRTIQFPYQDRIESCRFDPLTGDYLLAGVTNRSVHGGMGYIKAGAWQLQQQAATHNHTNETNDEPTHVPPASAASSSPPQWYSYPAHAGPIYTMASRLGHRQRHTGGDGTSTTKPLQQQQQHVMATGGSDAVVAIWDASTMTCTSTISSRTKFIRSLAFSHPHHENDPLLLAIATEEDVIELIDCSNVGGSSTGGGTAPAATTTTSIGLMPLSSNNNHTARRSMPAAGAEDICFHPTIPNLLACARTSEVATLSSSSMSSVTMLKFTISSG